MKSILIIASAAGLLATVSAHANETIGSAVDKLASSAIGGMRAMVGPGTKGDPIVAADSYPVRPQSDPDFPGTGHARYYGL